MIDYKRLQEQRSKGWQFGRPREEGSELGEIGSCVGSFRREGAIGSLRVVLDGVNSKLKDF